MFYSLILILKYFKYKISETEVYGLVSIILVGIIKLFIGIYLGKPVGFLIAILLSELIVLVIITRSYFRRQSK
jgi:ABC-type phosphate transport system permease subunit